MDQQQKLVTFAHPHQQHQEEENNPQDTAHGETDAETAKRLLKELDEEYYAVLLPREKAYHQALDRLKQQEEVLLRQVLDHSEDRRQVLERNQQEAEARLCQALFDEDDDDSDSSSSSSSPDNDPMGKLLLEADDEDNPYANSAAADNAAAVTVPNDLIVDHMSL